MIELPDDRDFARVEAATRRARPPAGTLREAVAVFARSRTPGPIAALVLVALVLRLFLGPARAWELWVAPGVLIGWPLMEWAAHRWILHLRPRRVLGLRFDPYFAQAHRRHHQNPSYFPDVFLPREVVFGAFVTFFAAFTLLWDAAFAATALVFVSLAALVYEWAHFIAHTDYTPRGAYARRLVRNHRLHHYRNERNWYAFTVPHLDDWLGTGGGAGDVDRSDTTRTLGQAPVAPAFRPERG